VTTIPISEDHAGAWLNLRQQLWPHCSQAQHRAEMQALLAAPSQFAQFICIDERGKPRGFAEASIRSDYVNGTASSPVAFLEGIFVEPESRQTGIARELVDAVSVWAGQQGVTELASDANLANSLSHTVHRALGFEETERVVFFRKPLKEGLSRADFTSRATSTPADVQIRPYRREDENALLEAIRESWRQVGPWMPWCHQNYSIDDARSWIQTAIEGARTGTLYDFAIFSQGGFAGGCGINNINNQDRVANLGYWLRTSCTGQGIASAAVKQLLGWTFANTDVNRVEIVVAVDNHRSQRVAAQVGAQRDAVLPMRTMANGRPSAAIMYSVLRLP